MKKFFTASFLLFSLLLPFSEAFASNSETEKSGGVSVRLTLSRIENSPEISAKISFSIPKGIHIYGKNPGGGGLPTKITWKLPKGASVSEGKWPEPQIFEFMGVKSLGYGGDFSVDYSIKSDSEITAKVEWLACGQLCVPGSAVLSEKIPPLEKNLHEVENSEGGIWPILLAAFAGGIILNLMPCVFPVIGIKIMSFTSSAGDTRSKALANSGAYSAGIVSSFLALGALLLWARSLGEEIGWGFQLQNPTFSASMALLFFAMGLSFAGAFEVGGLSPAGKFGGGKYLSSFLSGVLAVLAASPCTAPFMGTAVGAALSSNAANSLAIFGAMGVGMAFPYVALTAFPPVMRALPKPGAWMDILKQILSIPLFASAIWLASVFGAQTGTPGLTRLLLAALALAVGLRIYGIWGTPVNPKKTRLISVALAALSIASAAFIAANSSNTGSKNSEGDWSAQKVESLRREGNVVVVDFTAAWCLTCQFNKIAFSEVKDVFKAENKTVLLTADWTNRNDSISKELEKFGRAGVPLCVVYPPSGEPIVLPAILTPELIIGAIDKAKK